MSALLVIIGCDVLFAILAVPLMLRKVPPNVIYGYRTRATLSDRAVMAHTRGFHQGPDPPKAQRFCLDDAKSHHGEAHPL